MTLRPFSLIAGHTNNNNISKIAIPYIEKLNKDLGDSVYLGVKNGNNVLYLLHYDSKKEVRINGCAGEQVAGLKGNRHMPDVLAFIKVSV